MRKIAIVTFVLVASFVSVAPTMAQAFCQDGRGEYIGGVYFPSARPGYDRASYMPCTPQDYVRIYEMQGGRRYFDGYGLLDWMPYGGYPGGGYWGRGQYGYFDGYGRPMGPTGKGALIGGALGAGIGIARGGAKGAAAGGLIGLGLGAIVGAIVERRHPEQPAQPNVQVPAGQAPMANVSAVAQPYPPNYQPAVVRPRTNQPELKFTVVNPWPVDAVVFYDSNPDEKWVVRRNSSYLQIPRRDGTPKALVTTTVTGGFEDLELTLVGDGKKFVIPQP